MVMSLLHYQIEICFYIFKSMGAVKSISSTYASNEYLFWYIEKKDLSKIGDLLEKKPELINCDLTVNYKTTPLHRAAFNGYLDVAKLLVEEFRADLDFKTRAGETPLMAAAKRDKLEMTKYLLERGCNPDIISPNGLTALDYAILQGNYTVSLEIYSQIKATKPKTPFEYYNLAYRYKYRFVDFEKVLGGLEKGEKQDKVGDFMTKPKRKFKDPVVDPRQSWREWILRNMEFSEPPLVERSSLPEELQPQNRKFAEIRHFLNKLTISPLAQQPHLHPRAGEETMSEFKLNEVNTEQIQIRSAQ